MNISDQQFQIYKDKLKTDINEYLEIDEQIAALNKAIKERRNRKKVISEQILQNMKNIDINDINVKNGRLVYNVTNTRQTLNRKNLVSGLQLYFNNNEQKALEVAKTILDNRQRIEKVSLKYEKKKK